LLPFSDIWQRHIRKREQDENMILIRLPQDMAEILQTVDVKNSLKIPKGLNNTLQKHVD